LHVDTLPNVVTSEKIRPQKGFCAESCIGLCSFA
jgi:hypothetical protein